MGTCFLYGNGGSSGAPLNFKVVGGTIQPGSPAENTIWVNTDTTITSWVFNSSQPENLTEGLVWIETKPGGTVVFNALKENGIYVYPFLVRQYVTDQWTTHDAFIYQNGTWVQFSKKRFYILNGSETADYTGGWTKGGNAYAGTTSEKDGIYLKTSSSASGSYRMTTGISDFAKYSSLKITQTTKVNGHYFRLVDSSGNKLAEASTYTDKSPVVIDLSGLNLSSDKLYRFGIYGSQVGGTSGASTKVTHIWLE